MRHRLVDLVALAGIERAMVEADRQTVLVDAATPLGQDFGLKPFIF